jgi:RNA polymerase sigma-70 factor (ECF subfamily)
MDNGSQKSLWNELRNGSEEALYELYKEFYPKLFLNGLKICKDPELTKDCINQVFLYFWEKHDKLGVANNVGGYIFTSFKRHLLSAKKSGAKYFHSEEKAFPSDELTSPSHEDFLIEDQENQELKKQVMTAVGKLGKRKQELLKLRFYEGLGYEEIAEKTGLSKRTIYNKIHEALKTLRQDFAPQYSLPQILGVFL